MALLTKKEEGTLAGVAMQLGGNSPPNKSDFEPGIGESDLGPGVWSRHGGGGSRREAEQQQPHGDVSWHHP